jgi:hypothetical protein
MSDASGVHQGRGPVHPDLASQVADHIHPALQEFPVHASTAGPDESDHDKLVVPEQGSEDVAAEHPVSASPERPEQEHLDAALTSRQDRDAAALQAGPLADQQGSDAQAGAEEHPDPSPAVALPDHQDPARS